MKAFSSSLFLPLGLFLFITVQAAERPDAGTCTDTGWLSEEEAASAEEMVCRLHFLLRGGNVTDMTAFVGRLSARPDKKSILNSWGDYGQTVLHRLTNRNLCRLLITQGADVDARDVNEATPLHQNALYAVKTLCRILLAYGAKVDATDKDGRTPLHCAACSGDKRALPVVELLVAAGADIHAKSKDGLTPLHMAAWSGNHAVVVFLLYKGALVDAKSNDGKTPWDLARERGHARSKMKDVLAHVRAYDCGQAGE